MDTSATRRTLDASALEQLVSAAVAAPSIHNTQPWRFRLLPDTATLQLRADPERSLRAADPSGRAVLISVGAAVFNLKVAARQFGWKPVVRLLPDLGEPRLLAEVQLTETVDAPGEPGPDLFAAIWRRHSSRLPFSSDPVPPEIIADLWEAARGEGATLRRAGPAEIRRVLALTAEAEHRNATDPGRREETRQWIGRPEGGPFGIPAAALGPQDAFGQLPVRDFGAPQNSGGPVAAPFETRPLIAVLTTEQDGRADWLRTGQALEHVLLLATVHQVRSSLFHQAMEWPDLRWALRDPRQGPGYVQLLIRLGYGPEGAPTPRQSPAAFIETQNPGEQGDGHRPRG